MAIISPNPSIQDLKLTIQESTLLFPPQNHQKSLFLSNIDQNLNFYVPTVFFFSPNKDYPPEAATHRLRSAFQKLLETYDFVAGRLKLNPDTGRLVIDSSNATGAGFVAASSALTLPELGDLLCPNPIFRQLARQTLPGIEDQPLLLLQVTSFKCGGLAIGMSVNHVLLDGLSAKAFTENLASQCFADGRQLAVLPCLDRRLLAARSPPHADFHHPECIKPDQLPSSGGFLGFDCEKEELSFNVFKLTPSHIDFLKNEAKKGKKTPTDPKLISSFNVATALIWRCKALSKKNDDENEICTLLNVIDLRSRLNNPPLPFSYFGNGIWVAYASAKRGEVKKLPFSELVGMVSEGPGRVTDEYARSMIDWMEINKGLPYGEYMVTSWLKLGLESVEYPWGRPVHSGPVVNHIKDICSVFPTGDGSVNALVSLPEEEMTRFCSEFVKILNIAADDTFAIGDETSKKISSVAIGDETSKEISSVA
ncbi:HXXXD-type acyl-transferase family protein [Striga asiatica]|uniref:HXXXD-type acyl-transferase family protein n=1 Tax=Striga asiatica TaxID=4170 RepID=A0A5A7QID5_STRAF|nr:HXXXD-type acyl-transferase family protein [Striga asiatica]